MLIYTRSVIPDDVAIEARFEFGEHVGKGSFGDVYRGIDRTNGAAVAIKRLRAHLDDTVAAERLALESRLLAQIDSPFVVRFVAHGRDGEGRPCLVLEWLEGEDLSKRRKRRPLTLAEAVDATRQAALGLEVLHRHGIVHRDVKPSNFFVLDRPDGALQIKLIDLGIARVATADLALTVEGIRLGTPAYMSPEQARGEHEIDARSDVFSLGVVLFELITGVRPFRARDPFAVLTKIVLQDAPAVSTFAPSTPADVVRIVARALSRPAEQRFQTAAAMAEALVHANLTTVDGEGDVDAPTDVLGSQSDLATIEQRVVTTLFAGFANTAESDEDIARFRALTSGHGGVMHRTLGARAVALFGLTRSRGDEAIRAAHSALEAQRTIAGVRLAMTTARVLSSSEGVSGEGIERGVADLDRAQGFVRVDATTARLLRDRFQIEGAEGEQVLRGVLSDTASHAVPLLFGMATPTVGRERELATLDASFAQCVEEPVARAVLLVGASGIGKSRVRYEFLRRVQENTPEALVLFGRGNAVGAGSPFALLSSAIRGWARVPDGGEAHARREALRAHLFERLGEALSERLVPFLGELSGIAYDDTHAPALRAARADPIVMGDAMCTAFADWLEHETSRRPVLLVLEDLQWGDLPSVRFVDAALRRLADRPLFVLGVARPEVHQTFPRVWIEREVQELRVAPLTRKAALKLAVHVLGPERDADANAVVERADGNAFHLEELLRAVRSGHDAALPDTVLGTVQARLDALGPDAKRILRLASVFGTTFWQGGLAATLGDEHAAVVSASLEDLVVREVVHRRDASVFAAETEYTFRNSLLRDAAYASLAAADRAQAHARAGAWLERAGCSDAIVVAEHFRMGGDPARARSHYRRGAEHALHGNDFAAAIVRAQAALEAGAEGVERGALRSIQTEAYRWQGRLEDALSCATEALRQFDPGSAGAFRAIGETAIILGRLGRVDDLEKVAEHFCTLSPTPESLDAALAAGARAAAQLVMIGRREITAKLFARIAECSAGAASLEPATHARIAQAEAIRASVDGDPESYLAFTQRSARGFQEAGDVRNATMQQANVGNALVQLGLWEEAEIVLREVIVTGTRLALPTPVNFAKHNLGLLLGSRGAFEEGCTMLRDLVRTFADQRDPRMETTCRVYLARILALRGDLDGAEVEARTAVAHSATMPSVQVVALASVASILLERGDTVGARTAAEDALATMSSVGNVEEGEATVRVVHAEALWASGEHDAARESLAHASRRLVERAQRIANPSWREAYLRRVPEHARTLARAEQWGVRL